MQSNRKMDILGTLLDSGYRDKVIGSQNGK